jgi:hypothetical protein
MGEAQESKSELRWSETGPEGHRSSHLLPSTT